MFYHKSFIFFFEEGYLRNNVELSVSINSEAIRFPNRLLPYCQQLLKQLIL